MDAELFFLQRPLKKTIRKIFLKFKHFEIFFKNKLIDLEILKFLVNLYVFFQSFIEFMEQNTSFNFFFQFEIRLMKNNFKSTLSI